MNKTRCILKKKSKKNKKSYKQSLSQNVKKNYHNKELSRRKLSRRKLSRRKKLLNNSKILRIDHKMYKIGGYNNYVRNIETFNIIIDKYKDQPGIVDQLNRDFIRACIFINGIQILNVEKGCKILSKFIPDDTKALNILKLCVQNYFADISVKLIRESQKYNIIYNNYEKYKVEILVNADGDINIKHQCLYQIKNTKTYKIDHFALFLTYINNQGNNNVEILGYGKNIDKAKENTYNLVRKNYIGNLIEGKLTLSKKYKYDVLVKSKQIPYMNNMELNKRNIIAKINSEIKSANIFINNKKVVNYINKYELDDKIFLNLMSLCLKDNNMEQYLQQKYNKGPLNHDVKLCGRMYEILIYKNDEDKIIITMKMTLVYKISQSRKIINYTGFILYVINNGEYEHMHSAHANTFKEAIDNANIKAKTSGYLYEQFEEKKASDAQLSTRVTVPAGLAGPAEQGRQGEQADQQIIDFPILECKANVSIDPIIDYKVIIELPLYNDIVENIKVVDKIKEFEQNINNSTIIINGVKMDSYTQAEQLIKSYPPKIQNEVFLLCNKAILIKYINPRIYLKLYGEKNPGVHEKIYKFEEENSTFDIKVDEEQVEISIVYICKIRDTRYSGLIYISNIEVGILISNSGNKNTMTIVSKPNAKPLPLRLE